MALKSAFCKALQVTDAQARVENHCPVGMDCQACSNSPSAPKRQLSLLTQIQAI